MPRSAQGPLVGAIGRTIAELDPDLPMANVQPMQRVLGDSLSRTSFTMTLLVIAALVALFLGTVGLYGVLAWLVSQRAPEIGVRLALGASAAAVRRMVLAHGVRLVAAGVLIGLGAAVLLSEVLAAQLYGVDPYTLAAATAILLGVASLLPAARAAATDPMETLRVG